jgi:hypothetical protein
MEDVALKKGDARRNRRYTAREIDQIRTLVRTGGLCDVFQGKQGFPILRCIDTLRSFQKDKRV